MNQIKILAPLEIFQQIKAHFTQKQFPIKLAQATSKENDFADISIQGSTLKLHNGDDSLVHPLWDENFHRQLQENQKTPLKKSLGKNPEKLSILDATGGFFCDALQMSRLCHKVLSCEVNPLLYCAAEISKISDLQSQFVADFYSKHSIEFKYHNAFHFSKKTPSAFNSVYIDPMFEHNNAALPKKKMQFLREIAENEELVELKELALKSLSIQRMIIKKSSQDEKSKNSSHIYEGKGHFFEVFIL